MCCSGTFVCFISTCKVGVVSVCVHVCVSESEITVNTLATLSMKPISCIMNTFIMSL